MPPNRKTIETYAVTKNMESRVNEFLRKDDYLDVGEGRLKEAYVVTGYDIQSTAGVEFVSVDPQYIRDLTPAPEQTANDDADDFFWINQGVTKEVTP